VSYGTKSFVIYVWHYGCALGNKAKFIFPRLIVCHLGHGDHRLKFRNIKRTTWELYFMVTSCFTFGVMLFRCTKRFKGKEIDVIVGFKGHIKGNDEAP
jgi:hypothetical protein